MDLVEFRDMTHPWLAKIYLTKCKAGGVTPNHFAIMEGVDLKGGEIASNQGHTQTNLDGFVHPVVKWTKKGLLDHNIKFVLTEDQVTLIYYLDSLSPFLIKY